MQREKAGIPAQSAEEQKMLKAMDTKKAKDKVKQRAREEKSKNERIEQKQQRRLARQLEEQYDQDNNLVQYGQVLPESQQDASSSNQVHGPAKKKVKRTKTTQPDMAEKRQMLAAEGGDAIWWKCDLCCTVVKKDEKKNREHRWNKKCNKEVTNRLKQGYISKEEYQELLAEKTTTLAQRQEEKQQKSQGKKKKSK